jgi:hypothetical protein
MAAINKPFEFGAAVHGRGDYAAKVKRSPAVGGGNLGGRKPNAAGNVTFVVEDKSVMESATFPKRGASPFDWKP